ncbi:MAG: SRPBCC domain-containing protein [Gammaproteobacteria bacterium]|nr:SRPBCC domain-containing protein [Gammaproteobacteria bacterium]MYK69894.1 SRPBCC domain-containing protein [Gammaproteobacteria bacterium]
MSAEANALRLARTVAATPEQVFEAWTSSGMMERWKHPDPSAGVEVDVDLRVGGRYSIRLEVDDGHVTAHGAYREIDPPCRLVYTWCWREPHPMRAETLVTVEFVPAEEGTEIRLSHEGLPTPEDKEGHEEGWKTCLERLVDLVSER